jgi:PEGA domain
VRNKTSSRILSACILFLPAALHPQMPPQPGKLEILSDPPSATVTINGHRMAQLTNATFLVSPGVYSVSVASTDGKLRCASTPMSVNAGQTVVHKCTAQGWS